jgi:hypothetical protein
MRIVRRRPAAALLALAALAVVTTTAPPGAGAAPLTSDPATAARLGGSWLAAQAQPDGSFGSVGATTDAALSLAAAGIARSTFDAALADLRGQAGTIAAEANPGRLGKTIMVAVAGGEDPRGFGGTDLVAALLATERGADPDAGLFGPDDPTFDGVFRQSLALLGLAAAGETAPAAAVTWLTGQQCPSGGWLSYRADVSAPCPTPDPVNFIGEDTNSTSLATQALVALGVAPAQDPLEWFATVQNDDGGFGFLGDTATDANSTGLVAQAIVAGGEDPGAGRWASGAASVHTALLGLQLGCDAAPADVGAFVFQAGGGADAFATSQAVPGAASRPFPLTSAGDGGIVVVDCAPTTTTTTQPAPTTTVAGVTSTTVQVLGVSVSGTLPATGGGTPGGLTPGELALLSVAALGAGTAMVMRGRRRPAGGST